MYISSIYCALEPWLKLSCPREGEEAAAAAHRFWETTARVLCFESVVFEKTVEGVRGDLVAVLRDLAEQPALESWLLVRRRDVRSIAPANAGEQI